MKLRLNITKNRGGAIVCFDGFKVIGAQGVVPWHELGPTVTASTFWDDPLYSNFANNIRNDISDYYCSGRLTFVDGVGNESILFQLREPLYFLQFELQQADAITFTPKDWILEGYRNERWVPIYIGINVRFEKDEVKTFDVLTSACTKRFVTLLVAVVWIS